MSNSCPACGKKYTLPAAAVGRAFVCKRCGLKLQITERGLTIPSVPDAGPPIPTPQPVHHGPRPAVDYEPVAPPRPAAPAQPVPAAYPPLDYFPAPPTPPYPAATQPRDEFDVIPADDESPPPRRRPPPGNTLIDYLLLRRHITPLLIVVFFWVGTLGSVASGFATVVGSLDTVQGVMIDGGLDPGDDAPLGGFKMPVLKEQRGFSSLQFVLGVLQMTVGPLLLRVMCEFVIVVFRINETLLDVKDRLGRDRT